MIFNSIDETCEYINTLLSKDILISEKNIKKICELNNISIKKQQYIEGDSYAPKVDSITLKDGELEVVYQKQSWLKHLPSLYHDNDFLKRFLAGFQQTHQLIETKIDNMSDQFRADKTEYIDWLASWLGITISNNVDEVSKRRLVSDMVRLYSIRGTSRYFVDIIKHLTDVEVRMESVTEYKKIHHNLMKKDFSKKLIHVYIDKKISTVQSIEDKKLHFIQMILDHEKPIGTRYKIIYEFKDEPIDSIKVQKEITESIKVDKPLSLEPVSEKIEELKEEFNKGLDLTKESIEVKEIKKETKELTEEQIFDLDKKEEETPVSIQKDKPKETLEKKEIQKEEKQEENSKKDEKLFKIDNDVDDYYSYDNLE